MEHTIRSLEGTWDTSVDAAYLPLRKLGKGDVVGNIAIEDPKIQGTVLLDLDGRGRIIGIEFVGAAALLGRDLLT